MVWKIIWKPNEPDTEQVLELEKRKVRDIKGAMIDTLQGKGHLEIVSLKVLEEFLLEVLENVRHKRDDIKRR